MAEIKVSEMIEAENVNDEDLIMIVQNGVNKKVPASKVGTGKAGGDTLPIGAVIDYDGETVPSNWEEVEDTEKTILYEDETGATGDITLNDTIENYKYFEIESYASFSGILSYANTGKLPIATKGRVHVNNNFVGASVVQLYCKRVELSGTSMHVVSDRIFTDQTITDGEYTYITKITGYKEA